MKGCLHESTLQAWLDAELSPEALAAARSHLSNCTACAARAHAAEETLTLVDDAWQADLPAGIPASMLRARIEAGLASRPVAADPWWRRLAFARWEIAAAAAVLAIAVIGAVVAARWPRIVPDPPASELALLASPDLPAQPAQAATAAPVPPADAATKSGRPAEQKSAPPLQTAARVASRQPARRPAWLESETSEHLEQTQLLLRSVRNIETEAVSDVAYEREFSRELLSRNRLLRRRAEQKENTRAEELLNHIEPLLLDIANLPDMPAPDEMVSLKALIRDQHVIAELQLYAGRSSF